MYRLRPLIFLLVISLKAEAISQKLTSSLEHQASTGAVATSDPNQRDRVSNESQSLSYFVGELKEHFDLQTSVVFKQPDYHQFLIQRADGSTFPLSDLYPSPVETTAEARAGYNQGPHKIYIDYLGTVTDSPFALQSGTLGVEEGFYNQSTVVGLKFTAMQQNQPQSYFINTD